jgi:hypothetical protein
MKIKVAIKLTIIVIAIITGMIGVNHPAYAASSHRALYRSCANNM